MSDVFIAYSLQWSSIKGQNKIDILSAFYDRIEGGKVLSDKKYELVENDEFFPFKPNILYGCIT